MQTHPFIAWIVAGRPENADLADLHDALATRAEKSILDARAAFETGDVARLESIARDVAAVFITAELSRLSGRVAALENAQAKAVSRVEPAAETPAPVDTGEQGEA